MGSFNSQIWVSGKGEVPIKVVHVPPNPNPKIVSSQKNLSSSPEPADAGAAKLSEPKSRMDTIVIESIVLVNYSP